jgi:photosystem II stability/assembly factor-like uncharacterized protein
MKKAVLLSIAALLTGLTSFAQWVPQTSGLNNFITSVFFVNTDTGFIAAFGGTILKTVDGGTNWDPQSSGTANDLYCVFFENADTGYVVGDVGTILKTIDGGAHWNAQTSGTTTWLAYVDFVGNTGNAVGGNGTILHTVDGGTPGQNNSPEQTLI